MRFGFVSTVTAVTMLTCGVLGWYHLCTPYTSGLAIATASHYFGYVNRYARERMKENATETFPTP